MSIQVRYFTASRPGGIGGVKRVRIEMPTAQYEELRDFLRILKKWEVGHAIDELGEALEGISAA